MSPQIQKIIFKALSLPIDCEHSLRLMSESAHSNIYAVQNKRGTPYLVCEALKDTAAKSEEDLRNILSPLPTVSVGFRLNPDGKISHILRKSFRTNDFDHIASLEVPNLLAASHTITSKSLKPLSEKFENALFEVHSTLRDVDGLHAPDALDEICKLIYAKLHDEENCHRSDQLLFQRLSYFSAEECAAEIRQLYLSAIAEDRAIFANKVPTYERSRGVFRGQLTLSSPAIARAVEILQNYSLSKSSVDIKGRAFQNILTPAIRSGMGQYFTPKEVIDWIVEIMRPNVRDLIIDPFCGSGHFLTSSIEYVRREHAKEDKLFHEFSFTRLHGIEKSDRMVRVAMTDMRLHGDGHSNIRCTDSLLPFPNYPDLYRETFDLVMTNPPFGVDLPPDSISHLGPFTLAADRRASTSLEILAIERCLQLLKPGGRLAIVLPDSILSNRNTAYVRNWIRQNSRVRAIISLPVETFSPFGANIKTSVLILRKLYSNESCSGDYQIFLAEAGSIGYDASGRPSNASELDAIAGGFRAFVEKEGW